MNNVNPEIYVSWRYDSASEAVRSSVTEMVEALGEGRKGEDDEVEEKGPYGRRREQWIPSGPDWIFALVTGILSTTILLTFS